MSEVTAKADRCQRLMNDPDLKQAFQDVRDALHRHIDELPVSVEPEILVDIKKRIHLLDSVWANLERAVSDGKLEEFNADQEKVAYLRDKECLRKQ